MKSNDPEPPADPMSAMAAQVASRLGDQRLAFLESTPLALGAGGVRQVILTACAECAGHESPVRDAACRTLQLCGIIPAPSDLTD